MKYFSALLLVIGFHLTAFGQCWKDFSNASFFSHGIKTDGTLWGWGYNNIYQLGNGTTVNTNTPVQIGTDNDWQIVSSRNSHVIALKTTGTIWVWGYSYGGIEHGMGTGTAAMIHTPTQVGTDNDWLSISHGIFHILALKSNGTLWAWGANSAGELGDGTNTDKNVPTQIGTDNDWQVISGGGTAGGSNDRHSLALKSDGTLWAWGGNNYGQLGDGTNISKNVPTQIGTDNDWKTIRALNNFSLATKTDGTLWAWGFNTNGELGDGTNIDKNVPTQIGTDIDWSYVNIKTDGTLWAWGLNNSGQLGDGTTINKNVPTQVGTATNWQASRAIDHTLSLTTSGTLMACGKNNLGQLGDGTNTDKLTHVQIGVSCCIMPTVPSNLLTGLVAHYTFTGGSTNDLTGNGHNGTVVGTGVVSGNDINGDSHCAYQFPGSNTDYIQIPSSTDFDFAAHSFSFSVWYKPSIVPVNDYEQLVGRGTGLNCPDTYGEYSLGLYDCRKPVVGINKQSCWDTYASSLPGNNDCDVLSNYYVSLGWQHVVSTYDYATQISTIYWNGHASSNVNGPCGPGTMDAGDLYMGDEFTGSLDEIRIYNRVLTPTEAGQLYSLGVSPCCNTAAGLSQIIEPLHPFSIYPNPVTEILRIKNNLNLKIQKIVITDVMGHIVLSATNNPEQINAKSFPDGVYYLQIYSGGIGYSYRFLKE